MTHRLMRFFPVLTFLFCALTLAAQSPDANWDILKGLSSGAEIRVIRTPSGSVSGAFRSATADSLVIATSKGEESVARTQIARVSVKKQGHRGRHTLIGLGIGASAGLIIGAVTDARSGCSGQGFCLDFLPNGGKEIFTPLGGIVGAIIGALMPSGGWRDIYVR